MYIHIYIYIYIYICSQTDLLVCTILPRPRRVKLNCEPGTRGDILDYDILIYMTSLVGAEYFGPPTGRRPCRRIGRWARTQAFTHWPQQLVCARTL